PATPKSSASAILIEQVQTDDVSVPAEFRFAIYERLIARLRQSGPFKQIVRSGDSQASSIQDLVTLHISFEQFTAGSQTQRERPKVLGATKIDVSTTVTASDGHTLMDRKIQGKVRFMGENLGATNDLAKRIAKLLAENFTRS